MLLSLSLIELYLSKRYQIISEIAEEDSLTIRGIRFLSTSNQELSPDYAYVDRMNGINSDLKYQNAAIISNKNSRLICLDCDFEEIINDLFAVFEYYSNWKLRLMEAAAKTVPLETMITIIHDFLNQNIIIVAMNGAVLAKRIDEHTAPDQEPPWYSFADKGMADPINIAQQMITEDGTDFCMLSSKLQLIKTLPPYRATFYAANLSVDEEAVAIVFLWGKEEKLPLCDLHLAEIMLPYLVKTMEFDGENPLLQSNKSILQSILDGNEPNPESTEKLLGKSGLLPPYNLLRINHSTRMDRPLLLALCKILGCTQVRNIAIEYDNAVVVLTSQTLVETLLKELQSSIDLQSYCCGISLPFRMVKDVIIAYRQATFASRFGESGGVTRCEEIAFPYLLKVLREQSTIMELLHPGIDILKSYDEANSTSLYPTLRCFLKNQCSRNQTARELFIHRNTLMYRLERIQKLTAIDFENEEERAYLYLTIRLHS